MNYRLTDDAKQLYVRRLWKKRWFKGVSCIAAVVVFCTVYALILPAITLEAGTNCEKKEHIHSEDCFTVQRRIVCSEDEHIHSESCYEMRNALTCGQDEVLPHTHNENCFHEASVLVCGQIEDETHQHTGSCYQMSRELVCGLVENEGHLHGSTCYEQVSTLICPVNEHRHDENCSAAEKSLACQKAEHQHTEICFAKMNGDPDADVETQADWDSAFENVQMTGEWAEDVLIIAETQIGYQESSLNNVITDGGELKGYTRYGAWYGEPYADWDAMFVSFCLHYAGVDEYPSESDCQKWVEALSSEPNEYYHEKDSHTPQEGNIVFFDSDEDGLADHVGIIKALIENEDESLLAETIEGDVENSVRYMERNLSEREVLGFAHIPENPDRDSIAESEERDEVNSEEERGNDEENEQEITLSAASEEGILVTVSGFASSFPGDPETLELTARVLTEGDDDPAAAAAFECLQENLDQAGIGARTTYLLDITIRRNGAEIEPLGPVIVGLSGVDEEISMIYHVEEDRVTEMSACELDEADIAFETEHFSYYGFVAVEKPLGTRAALPLKAAQTTSFTVEKVWSDFWKSHDPVTVRLMRTDSSGNTSEVSGVTPLVLSAQNNWKGTFNNLPVLSAGESYSVVESPVPEGYLAQYGAVEVQQATGGQYWVPVSNNTLVSGRTYALRVQNQNFVLGQSTTASTRMTRTPATPGGRVTVNGVTYANHFAYDDIPAGAQWTVTASGSYFKLGNGRGYYMHEEALTTTASRASRFSFANGRLRCVDEDNEYMYWASSYYTLSERSYETFQLYELVTIPASGSVYKTTIRNKPLPAPHSETLTVRKVWSDSWEEHDPVTVHLMEQNENGGMSASDVPPVTLSNENGWTGMFTGLSSDENGRFPYTVYEEPVEGYITSYGPVTETAGTGGDVWLPVSDNQLTDGMTYAFYARNGVFAQSDPSYQYIQTAPVTRNGSITFDGVTYSNYLSDVPAGAQWTASEFGSYFQLQNGNHRYLGGEGGYFAVTSGAHGYSFSNGNLYDNNSKRYIFWNSTSYQSTTNSGSAQSFQLYVKIDADAGGGGHEVTVTNTKYYPQQLPIDPDLEFHKQIDYLGDGAGNPDTSVAGLDDYRLYLDVIGSHQPVDLLIVADVTDSMKYSLNGATDRKTALDAIVNGTVTSGNNSTANSARNAGRAGDGIIYNFLQMHPENKVAVVCFSGGNDFCGSNGSSYNGSPNGSLYTEVLERCCPITQGWTDKNGLTNGNTTDPKRYYCRVTRADETPGTNYEIALKRAHEMLEQVKDDGHLKVMIFLTDGEPNVNIINGRIYKNETSEAARQAMRDHTKDEFVTFLNTHPGLITYIVGISQDANDSTKTAYAVLTGIANEGHVTYFPADSATQLETALQTIIDNSKLSLVEINDTLSEYVEYNSTQPDIKVTRKDKNGIVTTVWKGNGPTDKNFDDNNVRIINSVQYEPNTKRVRVVFNKDCYLDGDNTFTLSFNVTLAEKANTEYFNSGYNAVGSANTDYNANETSSGKSGFFSNADAFVSFTAYRVGYVEEYPDPVVQSRILKLLIDKISESNESTSIPLAGAEFDLYREADQNEQNAVLLPTFTNVYGVKVNNSGLITGTDGSAEMQALMPGRYYLVETKAPDGYYAPSKPMAFDIEADDRISGNGEKEGISVVADPAFAANAIAGTTDNNNVLHLIVKNETAHPLPDTGGIGATMFILSGLLLSAGACIYGYMRCRRERRSKG